MLRRGVRVFNHRHLTMMLDLLLHSRPYIHHTMT